MIPQKSPATVDAPQLSPERQLLWDAANWLEQNGWKPNDGGCAIRAMLAITYYSCTNDYRNARRILEQRIGTQNIADWSDNADGPTVIQALRDAAVS